MLEEGSAHRGQQPFKRLPTTSHHYHPNTKGPGQWPAYCGLNTSQTPILALDHRECGTAPWAPLPFSSQGFFRCLVSNSYMDSSWRGPQYQGIGERQCSVTSNYNGIGTRFSVATKLRKWPLSFLTHTTGFDSFMYTLRCCLPRGP